MIRFKNFIKYIIRVTAIIFLSGEISLADFEDAMDAINERNFQNCSNFLKG